MMINGNSDIGLLDLPPQVVERSFDREPFGFNHNLNSLDIFELGSLKKLAEGYNGHECDYFLTSSASAPDERFRATKSVDVGLTEAFSCLDSRSIRVLLKHPENYDPRFRK